VATGTAALPFFAAGKPVPVNSAALWKPLFGYPIKTKNKELLIALAGPLANIVLAFICLIIIALIGFTGYSPSGDLSLQKLVVQCLYL
ncbi:M50 family metallopeptidase, partial [bacterium LRH843]|nr:M50 family metallopeptidase [bacterium LRH843]